MSSILLTKCTGIAVFDQANEDAQEAAEELGTSEPEFLGPSTCEDPTGQIETMTNAATQGVDAVMISNNAGEQIQSGVDATTDADVSVVSWDSPIPSGEGESLFVAQVDFDETGVVMADMALEILGDQGGQFAILSASSDAANQNAWIAALEEALKDEKYANLDLVDTVYGNDDSDESYNQALGLIDSHPDLKLIMAPTTVGIAAAGTRPGGRQAAALPDACPHDSSMFEHCRSARGRGQGNVAYGAAKADQAHQVRLLTTELGPLGVRVNGVNPDGVVRGSGIFEGAWGEERAKVYGVPPEDLGKFYAGRTVLGHEVLPEHVANAVFALCSGELALTTGTILPVDSGVPMAFLR
jgi:NAD(P)-dependent dehydrogenase (short-subunit alcohol dehydrogenase family)